MAEKNSGVEVAIPAEINGRNKYRDLPDGNVIIELPPNVQVMIDGEEKDISHYTMVVKGTQVNREDETIFLPTKNSKDEDFLIHLQYSRSHRDENGQWANELLGEVTVPSIELARGVAAANEAYQNAGYRIIMPKQIKERDMIHDVVVNDKDKCIVTMPPFTKVQEKDGDVIDAAYMTFMVNKSQISYPKNDPKNFCVWMPKPADGREWDIQLRKSERIPKKDAPTEFEVATTNYTVTPAALKACMDDYQEQTSKFAADRAKAREARQKDAQSEGELEVEEGYVPELLDHDIPFGNSKSEFVPVNDPKPALAEDIAHSVRAAASVSPAKNAERELSR